MKKLKKTSELFWVFGTMFVALGIAICSKTNLGVSMVAAPAFICYDFFVQFFSGLTVGVCEYLFQLVLLIVLCILIRKFNWKYLLGYATAVIYGYCLDLFLLILGSEPYESVVTRWIMLVIGDISVAFGVACYFKTYMPLQIYELFVTEFALAKKRNQNQVKSIFDISMLMISVLLAFLLFLNDDAFDWTTIWKSNFHYLGLGTLVTTVISSPLITGFSKLLDGISLHDSMFPKFRDFLKK